MSGKSQTIGDFTASRLSQILPTNENISDRLGWTGTNPENRERFYFPDASQVSAMVGDHSRHLSRRGRRRSSVMDFAHYQSPKLLGSSRPIRQVSIFGALSISGQIHRENQRENCGDYPI